MNPGQPPSHEQYPQQPQYPQQQPQYPQNPQQYPQQPQQYPYAQQQPKKSNGVLIAVIVLVALFLLGGAGVGGYFLLSDDDKDDDGSSQSKDDDGKDDNKKKNPLAEYSVTTDSGATFALVGDYTIDKEEPVRTSIKVVLEAPKQSGVEDTNEIAFLHYAREGRGEDLLDQLEPAVKRKYPDHKVEEFTRSDLPGFVRGSVYYPTCDLTDSSCKNHIAFTFADENNAIFLAGTYLDFDKAAEEDGFDPAEYPQVDKATLTKLKDAGIEVPNAVTDTIATVVVADTMQFAPVEDDAESSESAESSTDSNVPAR